MQNNKSYEEFVKGLKHDLDIYHIMNISSLSNYLFLYRIFSYLAISSLTILVIYSASIIIFHTDRIYAYILIGISLLLKYIEFLIDIAISYTNKNTVPMYRSAIIIERFYQYLKDIGQENNPHKDQMLENLFSELDIENNIE